MVIHVFLIIENTPSWAFYIQNSAPNNKTTSMPPPQSIKALLRLEEKNLKRSRFILFKEKYFEDFFKKMRESSQELCKATPFQ